MCTGKLTNYEFDKHKLTVESPPQAGEWRSTIPSLPNNEVNNLGGRALVQRLAT